MPRFNFELQLCTECSSNLTNDREVPVAFLRGRFIPFGIVACPHIRATQAAIEATPAAPAKGRGKETKG